MPGPLIGNWSRPDFLDQSVPISTGTDFRSGMDIPGHNPEKLDPKLRAIKRGQFRIKLISPMGTTSKVLDTRKYDYSTKRLDEDHFMTVQLWDEKAVGDWTLIVENTNQKNGKYPKIFELDLHIRGTGNDQYDTRRSY